MRESVLDMGLKDSLPFFGMVMSTLFLVGNMEISKAAMSAGMNTYILVVYSSALTTLIFLPYSYNPFRSQCPSVNFALQFRLFILSLIGSSGLIFEYAGILYSSPTLGTAMLILIPAFTFILAVIFRIERLEWSNSTSQAKIIGTIVSITGAFIVTFYKGPPILITPSLTVSSSQLLLSPQSSWILGGILLMADAFSYSAWYIVQASILKEYPEMLVDMLFYLSFYSTILSAVFTLIIVRDPSAWTLRLDMGLVAILYSAVVSSVLRGILSAWCLWKTGPLFCSMFKPLGIIFAVAIDVLLGDELCLGSLIGAALTVSGFYAVLWGKANEEKMGEHIGAVSFGSSCEKIPLLQNRIEEA